MVPSQMANNQKQSTAVVMILFIFLSVQDIIANAAAEIIVEDIRTHSSKCMKAVSLLRGG